MISFDIIFFATGEYMGVSRQFTVMTALLKDLFLWFITEGVLVLECSEVGPGKLGQICLGVFQYRDVYKQAAQTHVTPCVASLTTCSPRGSLHSACPVIGQAKYYQQHDASLILYVRVFTVPVGFVHSLPLKTLQNRVRPLPIPSYPVCTGDEADGADGHLRNTKRLSV